MTRNKALDSFRSRHPPHTLDWSPRDREGLPTEERHMYWRVHMTTQRTEILYSILNITPGVQTLNNVIATPVKGDRNGCPTNDHPISMFRPVFSIEKGKGSLLSTVVDSGGHSSGEGKPGRCEPWWSLRSNCVSELVYPFTFVVNTYTVFFTIRMLLLWRDKVRAT